MRTKNTFSILFWADQKNSTNTQALLYARITVNQKRVNISLKRKVHVSLWDPKKKKAKGNSKEARQVNLYLDQVHAQLFQCYQDLKFKNKLIKANYLGEGGNNKSMKELVEYHSNKIEGTLAPGSIINFGITENYITKFLKQKRDTSPILIRQ